MKKAASPPAKKKKKSAKPSRRWLPLLLRIALVALVLLGGWTVYLDAQVTSRFEGRRFELPSRVYARPLEIYEGASLTVGQIEQELLASGYRRAAADRPGRYERSGGRLRIHTRGFEFTDGAEPARLVDVTVSGKTVSRMRVSNDPAAAIVRIEPAQIGGIYPTHQEDRVLVQLDTLPPLFAQTLMAIEDRRFREHAGISVAGIARAAWVNLKAGEVVQGGSTLTQQLVKNMFLTRDQNLIRKANEAIMALLLELHYDKDTILETYINEVYLGQAGRRAIHGFALASQFYFAESLQSLEPHQIATLVGLIKGPSYYDPRRHPQRALERRNLVLRVMEADELLSPEQAQIALQKPLGITDQPQFSENRYPAFIDLVRRHLAREYKEEDLRSEGLRIFTTLSPSLQQAAEKSVADGAAALASASSDKDQSPLEAALVVTSRDSGEVVSLVGGRDPHFAGFNRALDAARPIGSLVKPFVYLTALQSPERFTLITPLEDRGLALVFENGDRWEPKNYDGEQHGEVPLHEALAHSYNLATVRMGLDAGLEQVVDTLEAFGVTEKIPEYPSLLLGAVTLTPAKVAELYQGLATGGFNMPLRSIRMVTDAEGEPLSRYSLEVRQVADPAVVHLVQYAMQEVVREGTGRSAYRFISDEINLAGKTGTTDEGRDSWFAGFSGDLVAVAWVGRDDNSPTHLTGATGALPIWSRFMAQASSDSFSPILPDGVQYFWVDEVAQAQTGENCENGRLVPFLVGSEPKRTTDCQGGLTRRIQNWFEGLFR